MDRNHLANPQRHQQQQVDATVLRLSAAHRIPSNADAAVLLAAVRAPTTLPDHRTTADAYALLSRWARQLANHRLSPPTSNNDSSGGDQQALLEDAVYAATMALASFGAASPVGAAAAAFLGAAAGALPSQLEVENVAEAIGVALMELSTVSWQAESQPQLQQQVVEHLIAAEAALLPAISFLPEATCWVVATLLRVLGNLPAVDPSALTAQLAPFYPAMRAATLSLFQDPGPCPALPAAPFSTRLYSAEALYGALKAGLAKHSGENAALAAAAALAAGGLLEGLARAAPAMQQPQSLHPLLRATAELLQHAAGQRNRCIQAAAAVAISQSYAACRLPSPTPHTTLCCLSTILNVVFAIDVLSTLAGKDARVASAAIAQHAQQRAILQHAAALTSVTISQLREGRLSRGELAQAVEISMQAAKRTHEQYRQYILSTSPQRSAALDHLPLQGLLVKLFAACFDVLAAATSVHANHAEHAVAVMSVAADLQFCRTAAPAYPPLLKSALETLQLDPPSAAAAAALLPDYSALVQPLEAHGGRPAWLIDALSATKAQFLFSALAPCCGSFTAEAATATALNGIAPLAFLYMAHPHPATAEASHRVVWAMLATQQAQHAQQLAPYYVTRALEGFPASSEAELNARVNLLAQGLATAAAALPAGCAVAVLCVRRVLGKCAEMAAGGACYDAAALALFRVATQQLLTVHHALVEAVVEELESFLLPSDEGEGHCLPGRLQGPACQCVFDAVAQAGDSVRKTGLVVWYQRLASRVIALQQRWQQQASGRSGGAEKQTTVEAPPPV